MGSCNCIQSVARRLWKAQSNRLEVIYYQKNIHFLSYQTTMLYFSPEPIQKVFSTKVTNNRSTDTLIITSELKGEIKEEV